MKETTNYGLVKPDLTDPVDIRVLNENFDTIDEELVKFYDIFKGGDFVPSFDLSTELDEIDVTEYLDHKEMSAAVNSGKTLRIWFTRTDTDSVCSALLTDIYESEDADITYYCGLFSHPYHNASYGEFVLIYDWGTAVWTLRRYGNFPQRFLNNVKGQVVQTVNGNAPDENGNVEVATSRTATSMDLSNWDNGTFTVDFDDGTRMNGTVTFDEAGNPVTIGDGTNTMTITWPTEVTE